jgi:signal transduction histidine kinase
MAVSSQQNSFGRLRKRSSGIIIGLILAAGIIGSLTTAYYVDQSSRGALNSRATDISFALSTDALQSLSGSSLDLESPTYRNIKQRLANIRSTDESLRFVYLLKVEDGQATMLVDSEPEISRDFSPPGQKLDSASAELLNIASTRTSFTEGPLTDRYGTWISGIAPVIDPQTGNVVAVVGIDKSANNFYLRVVSFALLPLLFCLVPLLAVLYDRRLQQKEQAMLQLRSRFVSVASHELRSPISGILWALKSLLQPGVKNLTIEQQVILLDMYQSAEESLATINEILDMSAMEKNKPQAAVHEPVELGNLIKTASKTLRLSATERGMKFAFIGNWNGDDCYTKGDKGALKRLFMNLLTNAIKYGRNDTTISIRRVQKAGLHVIAIEDHGIGIPETEQRRVLTGYYRATNAQKTQKAGTGLGLLLAKRVAEQHGGKLTINSREGSGTTVYVSLPVYESHK